MAWRSSMSIVIGPGATQRWTFSWGGADRGVQYFMAHPVFVGETLVLSNQTKASVAAVGGGIFYAATVNNPGLARAIFVWEGGGVI